MKRFLVFAMLLFTAFVFVGCNDKVSTTLTETTSNIVTTITDAITSITSSDVITTDNDPVIEGATDKTIEKNSTFVPLAGITASDVEDGDLTSQIVYNGNVNPMAVGEYTATYTVTDSDGNITSVQITVTVVYTDTQAPLLVGTADTTIYVGEDFDPMDGVSANDTIDGVVSVEATGTVDVWTVGEYTVNYSASDAAGNSVSDSRTITVTFGDFVFGDATNYALADLSLDSGVYSTPAFSGGEINTSIADFAYVKVELTLTSDAAGSATIALGTLESSATELTLTGTQESFTVYYLIDAALTDAVFTIEPVTANLTDISVAISFAEIRDMIAPTLNLPSDEIAYAVGYTEAGLTELLLTAVTASDNIDGNVTSLVTVDISTVDLQTPGEYTVTYHVSDSAGNETTETRNLVVGNLVDSGYISDPTFQNSGDAQWNEKSNDGQATVAYDSNEGTMIITVTSLGNWLSAAGAYLQESTEGLETDQWYMFTFTVKTTIDRTMGFRMGLTTDSSNGWIDDFDGRSSIQLALTSEYQTYTFYFKLDSLTSTSGADTFSIELNLGNLNYSNIGTNGVTTFKDVYLYKVVTAFEAPTYVQNTGADLPIKLTVGDAAPNWADYVTFYDMSKQVVVPTIDSSAVDMNTAGTYDVVFTATDSHNMTSTYTLQIQVIAVENADTTGPILTLDPNVPTTIDQFTSISVDLTALVSAVDAVDGAITILPSMVNDGGLDFDVAGTYTVTYTVYDLSGNITTLDVIVTINDKEAPTINVNNFTLNAGDQFDPLASVTITDNVDGTIDPANVTVTGLDAFMSNGFALTEGTFDITFEVSDAAGNVASKTVSVTVTNLVWNESSAVDLLGNWDEAPTHSTVTYDGTEDAYLITAIDPNTDSWDHARWVYYFNTSELEYGKTYKFEITVKADTATDLYFRVGATLWVDPWIGDFTGGLQTISITDSYVTYQVIFTVDQEMVNGTAKFQFMYGYLASDATNTIYIKSFNLVQEQEPTYVTVMDMPTPDEVANCTGTVDVVEDAYYISNIVQATYDWDPGRIVYYLSDTYLQQGVTYRIVFTAKATTDTEVHLRIGSTLWVDPWIDNFTGGLATVYLTGDYVTYEFVFTVDKDIPNGSAKFQFMYGFLATDAGNEIWIKDFALEQVIPPHNVDEVLIDDFTYEDEAAFEAEWTYRSSGTNYATSDDMTLNPDEDSFTFVLPATANEGWIVARAYDSLASFGVTDDYGILAFYLTNNTNVTSASVWLYWSGSQNAYTVTLPAIGESGWVYVVISDSGHTATEITDFGLGFNNWSSSPITGSFTISYVTCVKEVSELDYIISAPIPVVESTEIVIEDFSYTDEAAFEADWTYRSSGVNTADAPDMYLEPEFNAMVFELPDVANEGWILARRYDSLANLGGVDGNNILAFYMTNNTDATTGSVWLYWSGGQNAYTVTLPAIGESGWVFLDITTSGKTVSEITDFGFGFNNWSSAPITGSFIIYQMLLIEDPMQLLSLEQEVIIFNTFESYADDADYQATTDDNIEGTRIISGTFVKANATLTTDGDNNYIIQNVGSGTNGLKIRITAAEIPNGVDYIAIWIKATDTTDMSNFRSFIYSASAYAEITSQIIADFNELANGTYVYIPVSALQSDTIIVSLVVTAGASATGQLIFDNILLTQGFVVEEVAPVNEAPVVSLSQASLATISGLTLEAGSSIESQFNDILAMVEINDAEDGAITPTLAMVTLNGLDLTNPVMGTYTVEIATVDSLGQASNTYSLTLDIVTVVEDFDSYTDDADFKANCAYLYGFRTSGSAWAASGGALAIVGDTNVLQVAYGGGTNGIRLYVDKATLEAAGASYVGLFFETSGELSGTISFQAFYYNSSGYQQIATYGTISYTDEGTYVYISVAELPSDVLSVSIMINVSSENTGTLTIDNLVIK